MNRRKLIYFLSAFVLIIGCYALNLSYSLFTQNITSENNVVDSTIPILNASLETDTFTVPANSSKIIKLKINNSSNVDMKYSISLDDTKGTIVQLVEGYSITGEVASGTEHKEVWVYVTNSTEIEVTDLKFKLDAKYTTIAFDENKFITASKFKKKEDGTLDTVKFLNNSILARAMDTTITDVEKTIYDESFNSSAITDISGANERKLIKAEDDYGTSYVFRGNITDNYVNFAGFTWRIVRINGDGSIRLILDRTLEEAKYFNSLYDDNAYVGYMYGYTGGEISKCLTKDTETKKYTVDSSTTYSTKGTCESAGGRWASTPYETTHINKNSSTIKTYIDAFYEEYLKTYESYIEDTMFCGDKSLADSSIGSNNTAKGYGTNKTYYAANKRLVYSSGATVKPTLKCAEGESNIFSRYTVSEQNINNVVTNGDLTYPIALISADELVLAGAFKSESNQSYYLFDAFANDTVYWWTMTPSHFEAGPISNFLSSTSSTGSLYIPAVEYLLKRASVRPVINLKTNLIIKSGDGTKEVTYDEQGNMLTEGPYVIN